MNRYVVACRMHCPWKSWQLIAWQPLSLRMHDRKNCQACAESMTLCFSRDFQRFSETSQPFFEAIFMFFFFFPGDFQSFFPTPLHFTTSALPQVSSANSGASSAVPPPTTTQQLVWAWRTLLSQFRGVFPINPY